MRLLTSSTVEVKSFLNEDLPDYAILSHTWADDEVSFQDLTKHSESLHQTAGYKKIQRCCKQAASEGLDYVWVDTCCIDKTSSAELSEAVNSMYFWYQRAQICYAYLADVPTSDSGHHQQPKTGSAFAGSRWFTRGWTLQELLAPSSLIFFDQNWIEIGTKVSLQKLISDRTGIDSQILMNYDTAAGISIARKMSWASKRKTTRLEDRAYCLMGIFGIKMPLLYDEGNNASKRLQLELLKVSTDHSLFAWTGEGAERGLLARTPAEFAHCGSVRRASICLPRLPFSMTNLGLSINLPLTWIPGDSSYFDKPRECGVRGQSQVLAVLDCQREDQQKEGRTMLAIQVEKRFAGIYVRKNANKIESLGADFLCRAEKYQVYFREPNLSGFGSLQMIKNPIKTNGFSVERLVSYPGDAYILTDAYPKMVWEGTKKYYD